MTRTFLAHIHKDGHTSRLRIDAAPQWQTAINKLPANQKVWLTLDTRPPKRSEQQSRLYWLYLNAIAEETGNEAEALHELFKKQFLFKGIKDMGVGKHKFVVEVFRSTTSLTKGEFVEYLRKIEALTGIPVPDSEAYLYGTKEEQEELKRNQPEYPMDYQEPRF